MRSHVLSQVRMLSNISAEELVLKLVNLTEDEVINRYLLALGVVESMP